MKLPWKIPPQLRRHVRTAQEVLRHADHLLDIVHRVRDGGPLEAALGGLAALSDLGRLFGPQEPAEAFLKRAGYTLLPSSTGPFLCTFLDFAEVALYDEEANVKLGFTEGRRAAVIWVEDKIESGPWLAKDVDLRASVRERVWNDADAQALVPGDHDDYRLQPLTPTRDYVGSPPQEWYVERMRRYEGTHRVIRLWGPSGVGKTTLARAMGRAMVPGGRTLKVAHAALNTLDLAAVIDLADYLSPDVLILDDMQTLGVRDVQTDTVNVDHLYFFETLHERVPLTVITQMATGFGRTWGEDARHGLRPGRIDETFELRAPNSTVRRKLIKAFLADFGLTMKPEQVNDIVDRSDDFTGAYLQELIRRVAVHGVDAYKTEARRMFREAYPPTPKRRTLRRQRPAVKDGKVRATARISDLRRWLEEHDVDVYGLPNNKRDPWVQRVEQTLKGVEDADSNTPTEG